MKVFALNKSRKEVSFVILSLSCVTLLWMCESNAKALSMDGQLLYGLPTMVILRP